MFVPITRKVNGIILASLVVCIGLVISYLALSQYGTQIAATDANLRSQSLIIYLSIKNLMLTGEAPVAVSYIADLKDTGLGYGISLFRTSGVEAFSDNQTIEQVDANNRTRGAKIFPPKPPTARNPARVSPDDAQFREAVGTGTDSLSQQSRGGRITRILYSPLINLPSCAACHGADHTIRGVLRISTDLTDAIVGPRRTLATAGVFFVAVVAILAGFLTQFLRRSVIEPIRRIGEVCAAVTRGRFDRTVKVTKSDEIGALGTTVNEMVRGLHERFLLSKFVSSSTIRSLQGGEQGKKVQMTLLFSDIRGFTPHAEKEAPETVVMYLNAVLGVQTDIIHRNGGDIDKYVGDEVVALFSGAEQELRACVSALEIQAALAKDRQLRYGGFRVGIGIDTGEVLLGMIGSETRADFTVIGDHVNNAARLCSIARGGRVLLSESTHRAVAPMVRARGPATVRVKGKEHDQQVFILESAASTRST